MVKIINIADVNELRCEKIAVARIDNGVGQLEEILRMQRSSRYPMCDV